MGASSLSAGSIVYDLLVSSEAVRAITTTIFPVAKEEAQLPYISYARKALRHEAVKGSSACCGADTIEIDVNCYASDYATSVELAEAVRSALDYQSYEGDEVSMRSCTLSNASEYWECDAFVQSLTFVLNI